MSFIREIRDIRGLVFPNSVELEKPLKRFSRREARNNTPLKRGVNEIDVLSFYEIPN